MPSPQFGWLHGNCIALETSIANLPQSIVLIDNAIGDTPAEARIVSPAGTDGDCNALLADRAETNLASGNVFYLVEADEPVEFAIGILGNYDSETLQYDYCFTSEGVKFSVSDDDRVVWQEYYYLGYDVEPTCP